MFQCYECQEWGHKRHECPRQTTSLTQGRNQQPSWVSQPTRTPQAPRGRGRPQQGGQPNQVKPSSRPPNTNPPRAATVNHVTIQEETEVQAQVYATLDPRGRNQQFSVMEIGGTSQGKTLSFLIDSGSSHSFLSPSTIKRLGLHTQAIGRNLRISLANGSSLTTLEQVVKIGFELRGFSTYQAFRILNMGKFQGILGMDWLHKNNAIIHCAQGSLSFIDAQGNQVLV